jgi:acyl-CoA thioesterase-2
MVQIFNMTASFQTAETGLEHQISMPDVPPPDGLKDIETLVRESGAEIPRACPPSSYRRPFSVRPVDPGQFLSTGSQNRAPVKQVWMRAIDRLPPDQFLHQVLLAYVSTMS